MNTKKNTKLFALTLLTTLLILTIVFPAISVGAQTEGTFVILESVGGTTDPAAGTHTYADGESVSINAIPTEASYVFQNWIISTSAGDSSVTDNPLVLPSVGGSTYTIQPIFSPIQAPPGRTLPSDIATAAIVVVLPAAGGTTSPLPGTYALANAENLMLTATPASGWQFSHWVISGQSLTHGPYDFDVTPADNPYNVNHGYGNTYNYQPVFIPTGTTEPTPAGQTPTPPPATVAGLSIEMIAIIGLVVVIIVILAAFAVFATRRRK